MPVRPYEIVYIIDPDVNEEDNGAMVERFRSLAETQGATELRVDTHTLGRRRMTYEINHKREGAYVIMNFLGEAKVPAEVERVLKITDNVLRSMVVRLDEMPPEPTPPPAAPPMEASAPPEVHEGGPIDVVDGDPEDGDSLHDEIGSPEGSGDNSDEPDPGDGN